MADNVLSVAVNFVENHRYTFPSGAPSTWTPTADPVRGAPKDKFIYIFMAVGTGQFQFLKACQALSSGELLEVAAADAMQGQFQGGALSTNANLPISTPSNTTRVADTLQQSRIRYFFYLSRTILDGGFILKLAASPPPELAIVTLDSLTVSPATIPITDPLTIAEQLAIDYEKPRRAYAALCAPFDEQSGAQRQATSDLLKKLAIAEIFLALDANVNGTPLSGFSQTPSDFAEQQRQLRESADTARDQAAMECVLWLTGPLMGFVRSVYGADASAANWIDDIPQLIKVEAAVLARIADSYRGMCHIRTLISSDQYLMRELMGRAGGSQPASFDKVKKAALSVWDVVTKLWLAVGATMAALEARTGPRVVAVNSTFTISRMITSYNTVFGSGLVTQTTLTRAKSFEWRDSLTGQTQNVLLNGPINSLALVTNDGRIVILERAQSSPTSKFTSAEFAKGIALINLTSAIAAAYDSLVSNTPQSTTDNAITATRLISGIVNTASFFPQEISTLLRLTGRGVAYVSLAGWVLSVATSALDTRDSLNKGDFDATFGNALATVGGALALTGALMTVSGGGLIVAVGAALGAVGLIIVLVGSAIAYLAADSDMDLMTSHSFLGVKSGQDSFQPAWAPAPLKAWANPQTGLDSQMQALCNLVFAFQATESLSLTANAHNVLVIDYGGYPPGATFQVGIRGAIQALAGGPPQPFAANLVIDPADPSVLTGAGALTAGSVQVLPGKIVIDALPSGFNPLAASLNNVTWSILMNTGLNPINSAAVGTPLAQGFVTTVPATIPASGTPLRVTNLNSNLSTEIA